MVKVGDFMKINKEGISELRFEVKDEIICERFGIQHDYCYGRPYDKNLPIVIDFANVDELKTTIALLMDLYNKVVEERVDRLKLHLPLVYELPFMQGLNRFFYETENGAYYERK